MGQVLKRTEKRPTVLIGKDARISGYMLESALEAGFASAGVDVLMARGRCPPRRGLLTRALRQSLGVVISASHNPFADTGSNSSRLMVKLPDDWEMAVEAALTMHLNGLTLPAWDACAGLKTLAPLYRVL